MRNVRRRASQGFRPSWALALGAAVAFPLLLGGCSTPLGSARQNFYAGRLDQAEHALTNKPFAKDKVLFLMERGTVRQARGAYADSVRDYIAASDEIDRLRTYSVSKGAGSLVINDNVQDFNGWPYERTLLHAFAAHDHLALADWDNAAVEARRIIKSLEPEQRGTYPEDAYSRYVAGFCLEMIDDNSNAALQYRKANALSKTVAIDPVTGRLKPKVLTPPAAPSATNAPPAGKSESDLMPPVVPGPSPGTNQAELVCFILAGRTLPGLDFDSPSSSAYTGSHRSGSPGMPAWWLPPTAATAYAELRCHGRLLGRSYVLTDTRELARMTMEKEALRKAAKTATRVAIKEVVSHQVSQKNETLGALTWLLLMLLEQPDERRWETLPQWLEVARVDCPADLKEFDVAFKSAGGVTLRTLRVTQPIQRRRNIFVALCRDLPPPPAPAAPAPPRKDEPAAPSAPALPPAKPPVRS